MEALPREAAEYAPLDHADVAQLSRDAALERLGLNEEVSVAEEEYLAALRIERTALRVRLVQLRVL